MNVAIETFNLTRDFGKFRAVNELNLRVEAGRFYGFLGPNGAGKSTTIKMLTGLLAPSGGTMRISAKMSGDPKRALAVKQRVGVVPENLALFDNLTAREYLTFIGRMYLLPRETVRTRAEELLSMMDLAHEEKKLTLEFSHGMKKKLALAAALIPNPICCFSTSHSRAWMPWPRRFCATRSSSASGAARQFFSRRTFWKSWKNFAPTSASSRRENWCIRARWKNCGTTALAGGQIHLGGRQRRARGAKIKLAGMNREQLKTILWLRWRLMCNQWRRSGGLGAVITVLVGAGAFMLMALCFIGGLAGGIFGLRDASPAVMMTVWFAVTAFFFSSG